MNFWRLGIVVLLMVGGMAGGCAKKPPEYGSERQLILPGSGSQVWAIAPAINLSGQREVDPILQADLVYQQLQQVRGLTVIPVNRVAEVYLALRIEQVQTEDQAALVCEMLGADGLLVPTVTAWHPYNPPRMGVALQLFSSSRSLQSRPAAIDARELVRQAAPLQDLSMPRQTSFRQVVGMFDAANGTVRDQLAGYAAGRHDPVGPMGDREFLMNMDRFSGFAYHTLITELLRGL